MSLLGWVDFSRSHRDKVMSVMDLFKEQGMVDELGLGTIRDSISNLLFPGTSTIQTRAKYFFLVPWIIRRVEKNCAPGRFLSMLDESEVGFIKVLKASQGKDEVGIIGARLKNSNPKRKPSSIYWNGLRAYGILRFEGSLADYAKASESHGRHRSGKTNLLLLADGDMAGDDKDAAHPETGLWRDPPMPPKEWERSLSIELTAEEARFLKERMSLSHPHSLLAYALKKGPELTARFGGIGDFLDLPDLPETLRAQIGIAVRFNALMKGALIRYNLLVQRKRKDVDDGELLRLWEAYREEMLKFNWNDWSAVALWSLCQSTPSRTMRFVEEWIALLRNESWDERKIDALIQQRELAMKTRKRARLQDPALAEKQKSWAGLSATDTGADYLTYRWRTVRTFLEDIAKPLEKNA